MKRNIGQINWCGVKLSRLLSRGFYALLLLLQIPPLTCPALAEGASFSAGAAGSDFGVVDADVGLRTIGPLHLSEGKVKITHNEICVLSDSSDPAAEAELSGAVISCRQFVENSAPYVRGLAVFTRGYSVTALENYSVQDSVTAVDGITRIGRIVDVNANLLRIKTAQGIQILQTSKITELKSPCAFVFTLPLSNSSAIKSQPAPAGFEPELITFTPTPLDGLALNSAKPGTKTLQAQLSERHIAKRAVKIGIFTAAAAACFAIPVAIGAITPRPKLSSNSSGASGN